MTGCGYPDVATRALVTKLHAKAPFLEPVGVCDYNPHGLALLLTYKATSRMSKSRFETSDVTTDAVKWLGLRSAHMQEIAPRLSKESLQPMGNRDVQKLQAMRRSDVVQGLPDYCEEISAMEEGVCLERWGAISVSSQGRTAVSVFVICYLPFFTVLLHTIFTSSLTPLTFTSHLISTITHLYLYLPPAAYKCELESMFELGLGFFSDWLEERLKERDFI